jgi:hypothetical protein
LASRARPCAARTRLFGFIATPNGALRAPSSAHRRFAASYSTPKKYLHSIELGPPTSRAFFYPLDHRGYEIGSPLGSNYVPMRPDAQIFSVFSFFYGLSIFSSFLFVILFFFVSPFPFPFLLILLFLFFSSYPSLLISSYSSRRCYSSSSSSSFGVIWGQIHVYTVATIRPNYFCFILFY